MDHWLHAWNKPGFRKEGRPAVVLLDYDGTLAPIAATPAQAKLPPATRRVLSRLANVPWLRLGLVSGRSLADLKQMVRLPNLIYAGNHGLELRGRGLSFTHPRVRTIRPLMRRLARQLDQALEDVPGAWVERKGATLSVHWRAVSSRAARRRFHRAVSRATLASRLRRQVQVTQGKRVIEIRPAVNWNKGQIIRWLHDRLDGQGDRRGWLIYFGDDQTDEDAFDVVRRLKGASIVVGRPKASTAATYWLRGPAEVRRSLERLAHVPGR